MSNNVPALQRGIEIIKTISENPNISISYIENKLKIPKASLNRLLQCLLENDIICYLENRKGLRIGNNLIYMSMKAYQNNPLVSFVKPMLKVLSEKWHTTFVVYEYVTDFKLIWRVKEEPDKGIMTQPECFVSKKLIMNAQGQLFLSYLSVNKLKEYIKLYPPEAITKYTLINYDDLVERMKEIQKQGYAYQERENNISMKQIAIPLKLRNMSGVYALGCFLYLDFDKVEELRMSMQIESSKLCDAE